MHQMSAWVRCLNWLLRQVADKFKDEPEFYYPHTLDFRGRAYPLHPHFNHMGSDACRGMLTFADAKPLGPDGLGWLYVLVCLVLC